MTGEELAEFLDEQSTVTLATIGPDHMPHLAAMWFTRDGDRLLLWTYAASQKVRNLERDPRASVLADDGSRYSQLRGACLECRVEILRDRADVMSIGRAMSGRYPDPAGRDGDDRAAEELLNARARKRVGLRLDVVRARTWDHRRLGDAAMTRRAGR
ncbi:pyridoxamine 5'-phosphate oxidase family protein [Streptomyces gilvus]|uniref:pyridoxamine 5'-phosphate oxidase family protein n=1 Tax=Streptomyces gilvus TaxID=2920937 RepID=UPI001F10B6DA|nr:TIGR03618 family F420-dependent PPOX class oxidoreductase [Streptomyces sp. CME 23]MCH5675651.1 TIGR03618 family F420-dependent PPOX class oxidoreductase [Streptomyces sp. CME 23]